MYNFQFSEFTMDPSNQRQFLPPLLSVNPFVMQLLDLQTNTMPLCEGFNGLSFNIKPAYQGIAQKHHRYRASRSGLSSNRRREGFRKAETQHRYNIVHESSRTICFDRSTGTHPGYAWMGASDNTGSRKVWRTPPKNSSMANHNSTQQMLKKPCKRDRYSRAWRRRTDMVDPSVYEIPIVKSKSMLILSILYQSFHQLFAGGATASGVNIPTPAPFGLSMWTTAAAAPPSRWKTYTETTRYRNAPKRTGKLLIEINH